MQPLEYFLKNGTGLKKMTISFGCRSWDSRLKSKVDDVFNELSMLPRGSAACQIVLR
ncbi:hypothetical protein SLEP1_g46567 [Rubroshorea leprosula]|uniref:Uncharacterized protein n=1 Tax=Rubroshorea leprosula TaxID=152421 RepID=A0AAV5LMN3_9ROSI|nr:hypothetical protein SLEP1_g46567 [Rubroshorea leprosula]